MPIQSSAPRVSSPLGHYGYIVESNPLQVIFVLSDSPKREACIVLRQTDRRFLTLPGWLYISDASSGNSQLLFSFYQLAKKILDEWDASRYFSCIIAHNKFERLIEAEPYPSYLISSETGKSQWLSDLMDTERDWEEAREELTAKYGYSVAAAQEVIRAWLRSERR